MILSRDYTLRASQQLEAELELDFVLHGDEWAGRPDAQWPFRADGPDQLDDALRSLGTVDDDTFVFLAGEATALTLLRRYLRHELGLPPEQVSASGYWRRGVVNLDHHAPLDPSDPD